MRAAPETPAIFTIGYGGRSSAELTALLQKYRLTALMDVRSQPHSAYYPDFCLPQLPQLLKRAGIAYRFMGDSLGGRPADRDCYRYSPLRKKAVLDPKRCATKDFYMRGIRELQAALAQGQRLALMCSERDPQNCHRSYVIGSTLAERGVAVLHIDRAGELQPQAALPAMIYQESLF